MLPIISLGQHLHIPSYYLFLSLGFCLGLIYFVRRADAVEMERKTATDLALWVLIASFIGARLFHVAYEIPEYYWNHPLEIFKIWQGGFVFFGGLAGAALATVLFAIQRKISFWYLADLATPPLSLGYIFGRIGCFLNGCCYGKRCLLSWAVEFQSHIHYGVPLMPRHPTQLYMALSEALILSVLLIVERVQAGRTFESKNYGNLFSLWMILHGLSRFAVELFRDDPRGTSLGPLSISALISIGLVLFGSYRLKRPQLKKS